MPIKSDNGSARGQLARYTACCFESDDILEVRRVPCGRSTWHTASELAAEADALAGDNNAGQHLYVGVNPRTKIGGRSGRDVALARCLFGDFDNTTPEQVAQELQATGFPEPTLTLDSGHGVHCYWRLTEPIMDLEVWTKFQRELAAALGSDPCVHDPPRIARLPGFTNLKPPVAECRILQADSSRVHELADLAEHIPEIEPELEAQRPQPPVVDRDADKGLSALARAAKYLEGVPGAVEGERGDDQTFRTCCVLVNDFGLTESQAWSMLVEWNRRCQPSWSERELQEKLQNAVKYAKQTPGNKLDASPRPSINVATASAPSAAPSCPWPQPLSNDAYHGLAGEIVHAIEPHTEADPAAMLLQLLTAFGNVIGRHAYFVADGVDHYTTMDCVLIGETSKSRKGTSWGHIARLFRSVDETWAGDHITEGLSSGEGLIWHVRDPSTKRIWSKENKQRDAEAQDDGVTDKRLLIQESEFASVLRAISRQGNTLSPVVRLAWDSGDLRTLTKNSPTKATGAHISIIGHITRDELVRYLDRTEVGNGFGNRIIWACVKRSKCLPEGGNISSVDFDGMVRRLGDAVRKAHSNVEMKRDKEARGLWIDVYSSLSEGMPGLFGALTSRAEAQVLRLSMIYALLDGSTVVGVNHLKAALAVWSYAADSVRYVFGDSLGDPVADELLKALNATPRGLTRTEIRDFFGRNRKSDQIDRVLVLLVERRLAVCRQESTGGRPVTRWFSAKYADRQ